MAARFRAPLLPLAALFAVANVAWCALGRDRWLAADHFNLALIRSRPYGGRQPNAELAGEALVTASRLDPSWNDPRVALQDVRRRAAAVPAVTPAVEAAQRRFQATAAGGAR